MYASFSSALTTRKERSDESGSKPKWRKTTTRGEMVSHGERREYGRSRERGGGGRGAPSNARETWSRPGRSTKWRRRTHRPPSGSSLALAVASLGGSFLSFSRSGASPTHPPLVVVLWFPLGPAVDKDCLALGPQSPKPYRLSWCVSSPAALSRGFLLPLPLYLVAPLPAPQAFPLFRCLSSSDRSSTEPPSNCSQFKILNLKSQTIF